jgi:hypothetical protein
MSSQYWQMKTEPELAAFQRFQIGNSCSFHAISTAFKLLLSVNFDPKILSDEIDYLWWRFKPMRIFPGWAVTPRNQKQIVKYLAKTRNLPVTASFTHSTPEHLMECLTRQDAVPLVTILWLRGHAPGIYLGDSSINRNADLHANAHTMLLAAYDPSHVTFGIGNTPWGFINSWCNGGSQLFWMRDDEFQRTWDFFLPLVGPRPLVLIERTACCLVT